MEIEVLFLGLHNTKNKNRKYHAEGTSSKM